MAIAELKKLVSPPATPFEVGTIERWREIEAELGTTLPPDYHDFVFAYGSGQFAGFYMVYNPFAASEYISLVPQGRRICEYNRESQKSYPKRFPYPYFPAPGGLLPWGNDENGNDYFWLTEGPPHTWLVVQDENRGKGIQVQPYTMTGFLAAILQHKVEPLASDYPQKSDYKFEPWDSAAA
jgi:hypothetical protein